MANLILRVIKLGIAVLIKMCMALGLATLVAAFWTCILGCFIVAWEAHRAYPGLSFPILLFAGASIHWIIQRPGVSGGRA